MLIDARDFNPSDPVSWMRHGNGWAAGLRRDGPGNWWVPDRREHFLALRLPVPDFLYGCQESSGNLQAQICPDAVSSLVVNGTGQLYAQSVTGWSRRFLGIAAGTGGVNTGWRTGTAALDVAAGESFAMVALLSFTDPVTTTRNILSMSVTGFDHMSVLAKKIRTRHNGVGTTGLLDHDGLSSVRQVVWYRNAVTNVSGTITNLESVIGTHDETARAGHFKGICCSGDQPECRIGWFAIYKGVNAERDWSAYLTTLRGA